MFTEKSFTGHSKNVTMIQSLMLVINVQIPSHTHTHIHDHRGLTHTINRHIHRPTITSPHSLRISCQTSASSASMEVQPASSSSSLINMKLLFVEMGVGYDQHGYSILFYSSRSIKFPFFRPFSLINCN